MSNSTELTFEQLGAKIRGLRVGHSFIVTTEKERRNSLVAAKAIGKRLVSKLRRTGGFTITALPE